MIIIPVNLQNPLVSNGVKCCHFNLILREANGEGMITMERLKAPQLSISAWEAADGLDVIISNLFNKGKSGCCVKRSSS